MTVRRPLMLVLSLAVFGCSSGPGAMSPDGSATSSDGGASFADGGAPGSDGGAPAILLGLTLHLENNTFDAAYFSSLDSFTRTFEAQGGKLTFEPRDSVVVAAAGPPQLLDWKTLEARGHSIGSHAAVGGTTAMTLSQFTTQVRMRYDQLAPRVTRLDHVSGNCGNVDWVQGIIDAGFKATTAVTVLCLYSMAAADRPAPYQALACTAPTDPVCHQAYPTETSQRLHPWRPQSGGHWLTDDASGRLVLFPGAGTLPCYEEEATANGSNITSCTLTQEDVTRALAELDGAIALRDPARLNTWYWIWGSWKLTAAEQPVLESFLTAVAQRVARGEVRWATLSEMYDAYLAWESTHR